ncbi:MAG: hypothetical protein CMJ77_08240 [Planctomycetaceae bacterium]|nr:hypothetical protein [Planctomycetaceae bacterium]
MQNRGTIGGNIGKASSLGDLLPLLLALDAQVSLASTRGERQDPTVNSVPVIVVRSWNLTN